MQKYVLDRIDHQSLDVHVVWGPMLGYEEEHHAKKATSFLPDARTRHFWTPAHVLAENFQGPLDLPEDERAWDTFLVYAPGVRWEQPVPPRPAYAMHVGRSMPDEQRFNGEKLYAEIHALLPSESEGSEAAGK